MKVGVLMGGISSERDISIQSGQSVLEFLDKSKYEVVPIVIDKKEDIIDKVRDIDFALLALHGKFGEDGTVQAVLKTLGIPYSGCDSLSSAICMDKDTTKKILKSCNIRTADWCMVGSIDEIDYERINNMGYPVVIKPNSGGSSVATFIIKDKAEVLNAVTEALKWDNEVMIEEYIKGDEITCPILDGKMLPVLAIKPNSEFFDFTSKYNDNGAEEVIIELPKDLHEEVEELAINTYKALKCTVYSRVDMIIHNNVPYILEVNTLPGMTKNSLFPKSAKGAGISFSELLDIVIEKSLEVRAQSN